MATKIEVYELMKKRSIEVPDSFEDFISLLEKAVVNSGEGQKLVGTEKNSSHFFGGSQRTEKLSIYLNYLQVGRKVYNEIINAALGEEKDSFGRIYKYSESSKGPKGDKFFEGLFFDKK